MRIILSLSFFILIGTSLFGQWQTSGNNVYYNSGFVGVGLVPTTRPFEVNGFAMTYFDGDNSKFLQFGHGGVNGYLFSNFGRFDFRVGASFAPENSVLSITSDGKVGIKTFNPVSVLSVNGGVESEEVQVKQDVADYVFEEDYNMLTLHQLENFIHENGHLPNIQTQEDVDNNRGHVKLGELSVSLMEKVEELTLHLIELNKRITKLESENVRLQNALEKKN